MWLCQDIWQSWLPDYVFPKRLPQRADLTAMTRADSGGQRPVSEAAAVPMSSNLDPRP